MASAVCRAFPSTLMVSFEVMMVAGVLMYAPLTSTRPASIQRSASLREHRPARAITFAIRSPLWFCSLMNNPFVEQDHIFKRAALEEAKRASDQDEVPIGAVIVDPATKTIVARGYNLTRTNNDPSAHAEIVAIRALCGMKKSQRIPGFDLYVTLEPCAMCAAAVSFARLNRVIIGALDLKGGGVIHGGKFYEQSTCHHRPDVLHGLLAAECGQILKDFFKVSKSKKEGILGKGSNGKRCSSIPYFLIKVFFTGKIYSKFIIVSTSFCFKKIRSTN